jgi:hypothetical protein
MQITMRRNHCIGDSSETYCLSYQCLNVGGGGLAASGQAQALYAGAIVQARRVQGAAAQP